LQEVDPRERVSVRSLVPGDEMSVLQRTT
jgi:hypothetical protein